MTGFAYGTRFAERPAFFDRDDRLSWHWREVTLSSVLVVTAAAGLVVWVWRRRRWRSSAAGPAL